MKNFPIGKLAKETGLKVETIRYYEKYGLISKPSRRECGYRDFTHKHIGQINFIKQAKTMCLTLNEIKKLSALVDKRSTKNEIHKFMKFKILDIETRIEDYKRAKQSLLSVLNECTTKKSVYECPLCKHLKS